ncbi:MAG: superoxide dismutase family protein [Candidatus Manganitrophus sp.]|nr:MAG: superoxide dismutase family protein [Candidatus Manganitrophus sp.]
MKIAVSVSKLSPGQHGLHIHAVGKCEGPDFKSAGGHLNPEGKKHGLQSPEGPHIRRPSESDRRTRRKRQDQK